MWSIIRSSVRGHTRRLISTSVAICLGVALLAGTLVLGDTIRANFDRLFTSALGTPDAVVRSANTLDTDGEFTQDLIDGSLADTIAELDGVDTVVPQIQGFGQLSGADGEKLGGNGPPTIAGTWIDDPELNPYELVEGRAPATPNEVVINRGVAQDGDLSVGNVTTVATPEPVEVTIVGIATFGGEDGLGPTTFTAFSLEGAEQHITGRSGEVTALLVRADDGVLADELVRELEILVPGGVEIISGTDLVSEANESIDEDFVGFFRMFLVVFAAVALLVATFSINNTFSIIAAQRQRSSALLRAIGAERRQVLGAMIGEALLIGVSAALIGLGVGVLVAQGLKALFDAFGFAFPSGGLTITATTVVVAPLVGIIVTMLASLAPAVRASRVAPLAALRDVEVDSSGSSIARLVVASVALVAGVAAVVRGALDASLPLTGLGAIATVVGAVAFGPVGVPAAAAVLGGPAASLRGVPGSLARRNAARTPRRTAATASALMVGIGVVTIFTAFAGSLRASVDDGVGAVIHGDLVIAGSQFGGGGLSPGLVTAVEELPEVDSAVGRAVGPVAIDGSTRQVSAIDPARAAGVLEPEVVDGSFAGMADGQLAVARPLADDNDWTVGTPLQVRFTDGTTETLEVAAVYEASTTLDELVIPRSTWDAHQVQSVDNMVVIGLAGDVDVETGRRAVEAATTRFAPPDVLTVDEFVEEATGAVDTFLALVYVMLALAIVIALMGIANTLSLSIHERVRELGLLRAVGASRAQVRAMIRWESVVIALFGTLAGMALGVFLGWSLVRAAGSGSFPISFALPVGQLVPVVIVGALAGVAAAIRPARRAARVDVIEALADSG